MNLRNRKIPTGPNQPRQKAPPKIPKAGPKTPKANPKGSKPTGVTKTGPSKTGGKKDAKAPSARERAQAAKKAKEAAQKQKQQQKEQDAKNKKKDAAQSKKAAGGKPNPPRKSPSDPKGRNHSNTSSSTLSSIDSEALATLEPSPDNRKQPVNFWLKPHLKVYTPTTPKDPRSPRSAGVQKTEMKKWGPYALPPFGKPFWQKSRKDGRLELLLPMLVTEQEKDAVEDRGRYEGMKGKFMDEIRRDRGGKRDGKDGAGESGGEDGNQGGDENNGGGEPAGPENRAGNDGGNGKGKEEDPIVFFSEDDDEDNDDEEEEDSSGSEQPPWSTDYPLTAERLAMPPPRDVQPKSYDVIELGAEFDGVDDEPQMENDAFLKSDHGYEEGWIGSKLLGVGSAGRAGLWVKLDRNGEVTDQICIKQKGNGNDQKLRKSLEAKIMEDLRDRANSGSVRILGYRRYPKIMAHRLYMEFCRHGDLYDLILRYRKKKQYFPEEFIWDVFHHMVNACKAMDMGPSKPKQPHLTTYVHRDIKPDNIFLAAPQSYDDGGIPIYPTARLGDFGLAIPTGEEDVHHNPYELKELGTYGYKAPEQKYGFEELELMSMSAEDREELDDFVPQGVTQDWPMLGTHTNIWGVGASMYELMVLTGLTFDLTKAVVEGRALGKVQTHRIPEYSKPLTDLVHQCLKSDPARRPTLQKLENIIESRRSYFRDRWSAGETVPEEAVLHLDPDEIDKMDIGPFVKGEHIQYDLDLEKRKTF